MLGFSTFYGYANIILEILARRLVGLRDMRFKVFLMIMILPKKMENLLQDTSPVSLAM